MTEKIFKITALIYFFYGPYYVIVSILYLFSVIPSFYVLTSPGYLSGMPHVIFTLIRCIMFICFGCCISMAWIKAGKLFQDIKAEIAGILLIFWCLWTNIYEIFSLFFFYFHKGFINFGFQYYVLGGPLTILNVTMSMLAVAGWVLLSIFLFGMKHTNNIFLYAGILWLLAPIAIFVIEIALVGIFPPFSPYLNFRFFLQGYLSLSFQIPLSIALGKAFLRMDQKSLFNYFAQTKKI